MKLELLKATIKNETGNLLSRVNFLDDTCTCMFGV